MIHITDLNHVSIVVKDLQASRHFYGDVLGMDEVPRPATFNFKGAWFRKGGAEIHLIHIDDASQPPGDAAAQPTEHADIARARHHAFAVADIDEVIRVLREHDIPIVIGPRPRGDGAIQTFCFDPDGHLVELHTLPPNSKSQL